jgi:hypothetical protein
MKHPSPALFQRDIVDQVLSYCVPPTPRRDFQPADVKSFVPPGSAWLVSAAFVCQAWLEPALKHYYRTLYIIRARTLPHVQRVGYRVKTLIVVIGEPSDYRGGDNPFIYFANLVTLDMFVWWWLHPRASTGPLLRQILRCPSLPKLFNLFLSCSDPAFFFDLLPVCKNLRLLVVEDHKGDTVRRASGSSHSEVLVPETVETLVIDHAGMTRIDTSLTPLFTAIRLVTLKIWGTADYRLVRQIFEASSSTLRVLSLLSLKHVVDEAEKPDAARNVAEMGRALALCTRVRFLQIGPTILFAMPIQSLFRLLASLPIEFLFALWRTFLKRVRLARLGVCRLPSPPFELVSDYGRLQIRLQTGAPVESETIGGVRCSRRRGTGNVAAHIRRAIA